MRKFLSLAICLMMTLCSGCALFKAHKSLIEVNGQKITQKDFDDAYNQEVENSILKQANVDLKAPENKFLYLTKKIHVVNKLVINEVIDQELKKHQVKVSNDDINKELDYVYNQVGGKDVLKKILEAQGFDEATFKKEIKRGLEINKLISKVIVLPKVGDSEVKKFYESKKQETFHMPKMVRASHILIIANKYDLKQEIEKDNKKISKSELEKKISEKMMELNYKANIILKKALKNPEGFNALVKKHSQDIMTVKKNGDLNFFDFESMPKSLSEAAFETKVGNIYPKVIKTDMGYHIIKVTDRREAGLVPFDEVKEEIRTSLYEDKKAVAFEKYIDGKLAKADIKYKDESYDPKNIEKELKGIMTSFVDEQKKKNSKAKTEK